MGRQCVPSRPSRLADSHGSGSGLVLLEQAGDGVGHLRAVAHPVADAILIETNRLGAFSSDRVIEADALNEAAITAAARIGHHHVVEGAVFGAAARKTNNDHDLTHRANGENRELYPKTPGLPGVPDQRIPGIMPFMPRIIFERPPLPIIFIIFCACSNWFSSLLTSCTCTPAPAAMRRLRLALMISGLRRSSGVMLLMMPSTRLTAFSSAPAGIDIWPAPGSLSINADNPPILRICWICALKSSRSKSLPFLTLSASFFASATSTEACACSIRESTSPMPRMRCAMRSGWNGSNPLGFSPTPMNLSGLPVTWRTDSARSEEHTSELQSPKD